jgi:hypothetical protein
VTGAAEIVAGAELDVLHSINWERVTIDVFCVRRWPFSCVCR